MIRATRQALSRSLGSRLSGDRHGAGMTVALHLAPGALFTLAALPLTRMASSRGLPPAVGLHAATMFVLVPAQLGVIAVAARRRTGSWRLAGALRYTHRLPRRQLLVLGTATLAWAGLVFTLTGPAAEAIRTSLFSWWPTHLDYAGHLADPSPYPRPLLVATWTSGLLTTTLVAPVVEELYFRGFLLPRLEHLGRWAPLVNTTLFAAYHLWSPWQAPSRIAATLPLFYATWRTRSLALAITVHVALNLIGDTLASIPTMLRG